jgi:molecular chaperone DnaK
VKEAEAHASEDARWREEIELRNQTDALVYSTERTLQEQGGMLSATDRRSVEQAIAETRDALNAQDLDRIKRAQDNLTRAAQALNEAIARAATAGAGTRQGGQGRQADEEVIDAEVVDERKS